MQNVGGVIVSGAGPVGLVTALGLAKAGVKVTLVEAEAGINDSPRAAIYYPTTLDILERYGLLEDALDVGYKSTEFHFRVPAKGTVIKLDSSILEGTVPHAFNLHLGQHVLAELVLKHLLRHPNADVRWNTSVTGIEQDARGVTVTVDTAAGSQKLRSEWMVGADGGRSTVRRLLDLPFEGFTWPDRFVATNVRFDFEKYGYAPINQVCDPVHWAVIARLGKEDLWRCTFGEDPNISDEEARRRIPDHYAALLPGDGKYEIVSSSPYRVHERCAPSFRVGRVLLAGDAAHVCNPCGGMGLTTGIVDAVAASDALFSVISGESDESMLDYYSEERRRVFLDVTTRISSNTKRTLSEKDPQQQLEDERGYRKASEDVAIGRQALMYPAGVLGNMTETGKFERPKVAA